MLGQSHLKAAHAGPQLGLSQGDSQEQDTWSVARQGLQEVRGLTGYVLAILIGREVQQGLDAAIHLRWPDSCQRERQEPHTANRLLPVIYLPAPLANLLMRRVSFSLRLINFHSDFIFLFR